MTELIKTLNKKDDPDTLIYPNIKPANIPAAAINSAKIDDNAVSTSKIQDNAVTSVKIAAGAITNAKIPDNEISRYKLNFTLYQHNYLIEAYNGTDRVHFLYRHLTTSSTPISDAGTLLAVLENECPNGIIGSYFYHTGFTADPTHDAVGINHFEGQDPYIMVYDDNDEEVAFTIAQITISEDSVKPLF